MNSDHVKKGMQQAPHRSLFNALGYTKEEMERPLVGIVSSYNEIVPGHMNLDKITQAVKMGVAMAGAHIIPVLCNCCRKISSQPFCQFFNLHILPAQQRSAAPPPLLPKCGQ